MTDGSELITDPCWDRPRPGPLSHSLSTELTQLNSGCSSFCFSASKQALLLVQLCKFKLVHNMPCDHYSDYVDYADVAITTMLIPF